MIGVFAYASLVNGKSASETLGRAIGPGTVADLYGFRRSWSVARNNRESEKTFARVSDGWVPDHVLLLNAAKAEPKDHLNGVIYTVAEPELKRLEEREKRYRLVEVRDRLTYRQENFESGDVPPFTEVHTFTGRPDHLICLPPPNSCVLESYLDAVLEGFKQLGGHELEIYHETTDDHEVDVLRTELISGEVEEDLPSKW